MRKLPSRGRSFVILPTFNERENLPAMLEALLALEPRLDVLIIDDNSPDGTGAIADEWAGRCPQVSTIHRASKQGLGTAYIAGFREAICQGADAVVTMDCDFSHAPADLPRLLAGLADADIVIGSRYISGGGTEGWPILRRLQSRAANQFARRWLGLKPHDCTGGFRAYRASLIAELLKQPLRSTGYSIQVELLYRAVRCHRARVLEIPIVFSERRRGKSKNSLREITQGLRSLVGLRRAVSYTSAIENQTALSAHEEVPVGPEEEKTPLQ
ncbi:MAG TPA: polyprenol monophosphomannose synthase [Armatimonadota bacterium]|nr:polyprenol monophosphomannose synthase [Armatimonadota bacterium]